MPTVMLYVLRDPRDDAIRYAGVTRSALARRLSDHIAAVRKEPTGGCWRVQWIRSLLHQDLRPVIEWAGETDEDGWPDAERRLIAALLHRGHRLTNSQPGGAGLPATLTADAATRRAATMRARRTLPDGTLRPFFSPETLAAMSERERGKTLSPETRAKIAAARRGARVDPEVVERRAAKLRGVPQTPEVIAARVAGRRAKGAWFPNAAPPNTCPDCNTQIRRSALRCRPCSDKAKVASR